MFRMQMIGSFVVSVGIGSVSVVVVCRVFVPFIACLGFGLGLARSSMQLQGFCPPIIYQDDTRGENCVEIVKTRVSIVARLMKHGWFN